MTPAVLYRFGRFELDDVRFELREDGAAVSVEPQVLSLLLLFARTPNQLLSKDEILQSVWGGRIVSDTALSSRIKSARRAIGDDGTAQEMIRTVYGRGFRFESDVMASGTPASVMPDAIPAIASRPSIAVLPLRVIGDAGAYAFLGEALAHEIIVELSRLRWLFVIARGSSFQLGEQHDSSKVIELLGARYYLTGVIERLGDALAISIELADVVNGGFVWCERYEAATAGLAEARAEIIANIVSALEIHIPEHEAQRALQIAPERLDAWSNYHLGLRHMYRFNRDDNAAALRLFTRAVEQDPHFARAYSALSFTHFQNAFLRYTPNLAEEAAQARRFAERALDFDFSDPSANVAMGRSLWLTGELEPSLQWLDRGIQLSPSYAQGIYARAWAETLLGNGPAGERDSRLALSLSPIDPLRYAMVATRALSHFVRDEHEEAAKWSDSAARDKGAHVHIAVIAAGCHAATGDIDRARFWAGEVRRINPQIGRSDFFRSFPFADSKARVQFSDALESLGL